MDKIKFDSKKFWNEHVEISNSINKKVMDGTATDLEKLIIGYGAMIKINYKELAESIIELKEFVSKCLDVRVDDLKDQNKLLTELKDCQETQIADFERRLETLEDQLCAFTNKYDVYGG